MYEYISGKAVAKEEYKIIVENHGIGYGINTSFNSLSEITVGEAVTIYTYLHVKEDAFLLYGFVTKEELQLFKMLISISGVGPKASLSVLSVLKADELAVAIATNDDKKIAKANGVGKKTAERIILELKDKFKSLDINKLEQESEIIFDKVILEEAEMALMVLGFKSSDAKKVIMNVYQENDRIEDILRKALMKL
ncbi:MAG: Holliday junction branch migration protein RuvA [Clostridia bacterium]|nr:Holliday junction branch migration protein RuvA [Clostridia bacterium]